MAPTIRRMTPEDAPEVTRLHIAAWEATYRGIVPDDVLDAVDYDEWVAMRRKRLSNPDNPALNWVLEDDGRIRAFAAAGTPRDDDVGPETVELYAIYARPGDTGKGYGRALMDHVLEQARAQGATDLTLWVLSANQDTIRFYGKAGLTRDARVSPVIDPWAQAEKIRMHCML